MAARVARLFFVAIAGVLAGLPCQQRVDQARADVPSRSGPRVPCVPQREEYGDLIVLETCGSYEEMGQQQASLLGPVASNLFDYQLAQYHAGVRSAAFSSRLALLAFDRIGLPLLSSLASDPDGAEAEQDGIAKGLGVARLDVRRFRLGALLGGSTVFVATRGATADGLQSSSPP